MKLNLKLVFKVEVIMSNRIHLLCDLHLIEYYVYYTTDLIRCQVEKMILDLNFHIEGGPQFHCIPSGIVFFCLISEGYISGYTCPESQFCALDLCIFSGSFSLENIIKSIKRHFNLETISYRIIQRDLPETVSDNHKQLFRSQKWSSFRMKIQP